MIRPVRPDRLTPPTHLIHDERGVTAVEFALVAPVLLLLLMGVYDLSYQLYVNSVLNGAIQHAGRNSTIEGAAGATTAIDNSIKNVVKQVVPGANFTFSRKSYSSFTNVGRPEDFVDVNTNGTCDSGESYTDTNLNLTWDADRGKSGQGGARDAVLYEVTVVYDRPFPMASLAGFTNTVTLKTETVLRNQPYNIPMGVVTTRTCS